jgi:hypothetical protein
MNSGSAISLATMPLGVENERGAQGDEIAGDVCGEKPLQADEPGRVDESAVEAEHPQQPRLFRLGCGRSHRGLAMNSEFYHTAQQAQPSAPQKERRSATGSRAVMPTSTPTAGEAAYKRVADRGAFRASGKRPLKPMAPSFVAAAAREHTAVPVSAHAPLRSAARENAVIAAAGTVARPPIGGILDAVNER